MSVSRPWALHFAFIKKTRAYPAEFGDHISQIVRSRKDAVWLH